MSATVTVVIPTFNYGRFIADAIKSVLAQTYPATEIIVVDDGSTDDTATVVAGFGEPVQYIHQENSGVCAARNLGVANSTGDYIAFLDADDTWEPTSIEKHVSRFEADGKIGLVHCGIREFDGQSGTTIQTHLDGGEDGVSENLLLWEGKVILGPGAVMVSRKAFDAVGGFDTRMKCGEDWDFCYRVARRFGVGFVPEPLINYRSHPAAAHRNVDEMERGMSMFLEKAFVDPEVEHLRTEAYGNFHKVMAGSYFQAGRYGKFAEHALRSIARRPSNLGYFLRKLPPSARKAS